MDSLCLHYQQCTRTTPKESWGFCGWWPENNSTDKGISLTCVHLTFAPGCWWCWAQHVCGRKYTSCPVQIATAFLARADPGSISSFIPFPLYCKHTPSAPTAQAPAFSKSHCSIDHFICPTWRSDIGKSNNIAGLNFPNKMRFRG